MTDRRPVRSFRIRAAALTAIAAAVVLALGAGAALRLSHEGRSPDRFVTLPVGSQLPSGAQCATWVRSHPLPESKAINRPYNSQVGHRVAAGFLSGDAPAASQIASRVDGDFTGSTHDILRWAACKWGVDEDLVYAQAAKESWWRQTTHGDWSTDPSICPPGHGLDADGLRGQCPESFGILQNRYRYEKTAWPGAERSTAMNADAAYAVWRSCFEGDETWLDSVDRGSAYRAGDASGCVGRWFSGRWHVASGDQYAAAVRDYQRTRVWERPDFQEP